jgi:hypothetical protein
MTGHLKRKSWAGQSVKSQETTFETTKSENASNLLSFAILDNDLLIAVFLCSVAIDYCLLIFNQR